MLGDKYIDLTEISIDEGNVICVITDTMWAHVLRDAVNVAYADLEKSYEKIRKKEGIKDD